MNKKELEKIVPKEIMAEVEHMQKTGIPRCMHCKIDWIKETEYTWKASCDCLENKNIRMCIG